MALEDHRVIFTRTLPTMGDSIPDPPHLVNDVPVTPQRDQHMIVGSNDVLGIVCHVCSF